MKIRAGTGCSFLALLFQRNCRSRHPTASSRWQARVNPRKEHIYERPSDVCTLRIVLLSIHYIFQLKYHTAALLLLHPSRRLHSISQAKFQPACRTSSLTFKINLFLISAMEASSPRMAFASLPNEVVSRVCELVESQPDLYNLSQVRRKFCIIAEKLLYTSVTISDVPFPHSLLDAFATKPVRRHWLRHLTLRYKLDYMSDACRSNERQIASVLYDLPSVEELDLSPPYWFVPDVLRSGYGVPNPTAEEQFTRCAIVTSSADRLLPPLQALHFTLQTTQSSLSVPALCLGQFLCHAPSPDV